MKNITTQCLGTFSVTSPSNRWTHVCLPVLFHILHHIIQLVELLQCVSRFGVDWNEDKFLHRWGQEGRGSTSVAEGCTDIVQTEQTPHRPVAGQEKRSRKGSRLKASSSSGYWSESMSSASSSLENKTQIFSHWATAEGTHTRSYPSQRDSHQS